VTAAIAGKLRIAAGPGLAYIAPIEDDFAGVAGAHGVEALFVIAPVEAVSDDLRDVETALEHDRHLVPGLVHFAAVDAADGELVEDYLVPVDGNVFGRDAEHSDLCAVTHVAEHLAEGVGIARHLEADVEALLHVELLLDVFEWCRAGVDGTGDADFLSQIATVLVGIGDDNVAGSGMARHGGGHDADGTGSGDKDVFAENGKGECGVDGVAKRIEDCGDLVGDAGRVAPDVGHWEDHIFGEGSVAIDADSESMGAEVTAAREAVSAATADDVTFSADELTDGEIGDVGADGYDFADELVTNDEPLTDGRSGPGIPVVNMEVGAADAGVENADFDVVDAHLRFRYVL
jgi:hypothetical protein